MFTVSRHWCPFVATRHIFITKCGKLAHTYVFSGIVNIHHSVWKPRTYIHVFGHCLYSSLSVETSYIHTCFLALFISITQCGNNVHTYMFSGIVHIHHSVWKPRTYIRVFGHGLYSSLSVETSYIHTYVFSGIVHIHHSVWKPRTCIRVFGHCSYSSLSVETSYIHTCVRILFIFITKCGNLAHTYVFSGIVHIHHSVWKPRTYIRVFGHCSYSSLSVETSYIHTCFRALFIFSTKCGNLVHIYVSSGIVHIHHSVWKPRTYIRVFGHCSYSLLSVETS